MAGTLINKQYQYYPTVGSLFGVDAQNQVSLKQLEDIRTRARKEHGGALPTHGFTIDVPIPGKQSHFVGRDAFVWVPPIWVANEKIKLPVIELLSGIPGEPSDWTRAAMADVDGAQVRRRPRWPRADHRDARRERLFYQRHRMRQQPARER